MSTESVAFAVRWRDIAQREEVERRIGALERFYAPLELGPAAFQHIDALSVTVGAIGLADLGERCLQWGAPFGARRPPAAEVLGSAGVQLGPAVVGIGLALAWSDELVRLITAPCGPVGGYTASSDDAEAWATHAVAAAVLAEGTARVDGGAVPELIAFGFVGAGRSLVAGVRPLPAATSVAIRADEVISEEWWPIAERWAPVKKEQAVAYTDAALVNSIARRTGGLDRVGVCLTGGAGSRVLAVALLQLGKQVSAITWGGPNSADVEAAGPLAEALKIDWSFRPTRRDDDAIAVRADADARFSDGASGLAHSDRVMPGGAPAVMVGGADEVGRAFYYRRLATRRKPEDADELADALFSEGRLPSATKEAQTSARAAAQRWAEHALTSGRSGWGALDVLCAEQRVAHRGRSQTPAIASEFLVGFASMDVLRGLSSLPLADRLSDGFHRHFVQARRPDLAPPAPPEPEPLPEPPSGLGRLAGRLRRAEPASEAPPPPGDPLLLALWEERPATRSRIADDVLRSPLLADALGEEFCEATREGFLAGRSAENDRALQAAGPVALDAALRELQAG